MDILSGERTPTLEYRYLGGRGDAEDSVDVEEDFFSIEVSHLDMPSAFISAFMAAYTTCSCSAPLACATGPLLVHSCVPVCMDSLMHN